ncbi:unnamed protein product [Sphagnum tenellum]
MSARSLQKPGRGGSKVQTRKLWRVSITRRSLSFSKGFVVNSPLEEGNVPENPIRRFVINPSVYEIIKTSLMNPEMEDLPTDYVGGRDFKIAKTKKGEYANYATSTWSFRTRPLNEIEQVAIQQYGLFNLADFRGSRPDADGVEMIKAMFAILWLVSRSISPPMVMPIVPMATATTVLHPVTQMRLAKRQLLQLRRLRVRLLYKQRA